MENIANMTRQAEANCGNCPAIGTAEVATVWKITVKWTHSGSLSRFIWFGRQENRQLVVNATSFWLMSSVDGSLLRCGPRSSKDLNNGSSKLIIGVA